MSECLNCQGVKSQAVLADDKDNQLCPAVGYQRVSICAPVTITPFARPGATVTTCCGRPTVVSGNAPCTGIRDGVCTFTINQTICVAVPVYFGATAEVAGTYANCIGASAEDICTNCTRPDDAEEVSL